MEARATDAVRYGAFDSAHGREHFLPGCTSTAAAAGCAPTRGLQESQAPRSGKVQVLWFLRRSRSPGLPLPCQPRPGKPGKPPTLATGSLPHCPHPSHGTLHCTTLHSLGSHGARNPGFPATRPPGVLGLGGGSTNPGVLHGAAQSRLCALATGQGRGETATFPRLLPPKARCNFMVLTLSRPCGVQLLHQQMGDRTLCPPWRFKVAQVRSPSRAGHNDA